MSKIFSNAHIKQVFGAEPVEAEPPSPVMRGGTDDDNIYATYVDGVLEVLIERDQWVLHRKLEASNNPPRSLAPPGRTTKL